MSVMIERSHAFFFLGGLYMGGWTNIFSDLVITGLVLYIVSPEIFTPDRWDKVKSYAWSYVKPPENIENIEMKTIESTTESNGLFNFSLLPSLPSLYPKIEVIPN